MIIKKIKSLVLDYLKKEVAREYTYNLQVSLVLLKTIYEETKKLIELGSIVALEEFPDKAYKANETLSFKNLEFFFNNRYLIAMLSDKDKQEFLEEVMNARLYVISEYTHEFNNMNLELFSLVIDDDDDGKDYQ